MNIWETGREGIKESEIGMRTDECDSMIIDKNSNEFLYGRMSAVEHTY